MWVVCSDKEQCCSHEKNLLISLSLEETTEMKEKEQNIILFMRVSSTRVQCPQLSSCTA